MRKGLALGALDLMGSLLLVVYALMNPPVLEQRSAIETYGRYAVVVTWPAGWDDDVDTWVRDPIGNVVWFAQERRGLMHLEQDDLGQRSDFLSGTAVSRNQERVILRGTVKGEYVVNVHAYRLSDRAPTPVRVVLWRLMGNDRKLYTRRIVLEQSRVEKTAFRFRINQAGGFAGVNLLPVQLVGS